MSAIFFWHITFQIEFSKFFGSRNCHYCVFSVSRFGSIDDFRLQNECFYGLKLPARAPRFGQRAQKCRLRLGYAASMIQSRVKRILHIGSFHENLLLFTWLRLFSDAGVQLMKNYRNSRVAVSCSALLILFVLLKRIRQALFSFFTTTIIFFFLSAVSGTHSKALLFWPWSLLYAAVAGWIPPTFGTKTAPSGKRCGCTLKVLDRVF
jgi:hypothetical protein